jgi:hypothetical protein
VELFGAIGPPRSETNTYVQVNFRYFLILSSLSVKSLFSAAFILDAAFKIFANPPSHRDGFGERHFH